MKIETEDGKKIEAIFRVLEMPQKEIVEHMDRIGEALLMDVVAEAFAQKDFSPEEELASKDDLAKFLLENCSEQEIKEFTAIVLHDVVVEYFSKMLKELPDEKREEIESILNSIE